MYSTRWGFPPSQLNKSSRIKTRLVLILLVKGVDLKQIYERAIQFYQNGQFSEAIELFLQLTENKKDASILNFLGMAYYAKGSLKESEYYLIEAINQSPTVEYLTNVGILYSSMGYYKKASKHLHRAIELDENYIDALINLSEVQRRLGDLQNAQTTIQKALQVDSNNIYANKQIALIHKTKGEFSNAIGDYTRILNTLPDDVDTLLSLAEIYVTLNINDEALNLYQRALATQPDLKNNLFLKGTIHQIYNKLFPSNRFELYNNTKLLKTIKKLFLSFGINTKNVVELQGYEGVLSLVCAQEKANVTLIQNEAFFIEKAKLIAKENQLDKNIVFIQKPTHLLKKDEIKLQDLIITNLFFETFFSFDTLLSLYHFKKNFLQKEGKIFPEEISLQAFLIQSNSLYQKGSASSIEGINISALNYYRPLYLYENIETHGYKKLSDEIELYHFDLYAPPTHHIQKTLTVTPTDNGICHGVAFWNVHHFNGQIVEDKQDKNTLIYLFDRPIDLQKDRQKELQFVYSNMAMFFI